MFKKKAGDFETGAAMSPRPFVQKSREVKIANVNCKKLSNADLIKTLALCLLGALFFVLANTNAIALLCFWKTLLGIPCPGCGLTRAFGLIAEFRFVDAMKMNILSLPLFLGGIIIEGATVFELLSSKPVLSYLRNIASNKVCISLVVFMAAASWVYNITSGI